MPYGVSDISPDISNGYKDIESKIAAYQAYAAVSKSMSEQKKTAGNSDALGAGQFSKQLSSLSSKQESFQRNIPTSFDQLISLIQKTDTKNGENGADTLKYLRKLLLETAIQMKPYVSKVIKEEAFKALNCSIQQTYKSISIYNLNPVQGISSIPANETIMVRLEDIDLFQNIKIKPSSLVGQVFYETTGFTNISDFKNYQNNENSFPMNYEIWDRVQSQNRSFFQDYSLPYNGISKTRIFDFQYYGSESTGNYLQVVFLNRDDTPPTTGNPFLFSANTIVKSIGDYYESIDIVDTKAMWGTLLNLLTGAFSAPLSIGQKENQGVTTIIMNRIFGLCESNEKEIDVSGTAKISPYDNVNDSFFELNEADRRNLDQSINNAQKGVVQFVECDNVELPINTQEIISSLTGITTNTPADVQVDIVESILDSIPQKWEQDFPGLAWQNPWNMDVLKKIPLAMALSLFASPKVLFPIFMFKSFLENQVLGLANQLIVSGNSIINVINSGVTSADTINSLSTQIMGSGVDFIRKFKKFVFGVVAKISEKFLEVLFETLKKNLLAIIKVILKDIYQKTKDKRVLILKTLIEAGEFIIQTAVAYRECKSLVGAIQKILQLINKQLPGIPPINKAVVAFADFLPGVSPVRAAINATEILQQNGVPTGPMPDGSPNKMILYQIATQEGMTIEDAQNGVVDIGVSILTGLPIGKSR